MSEAQLDKVMAAVRDAMLDRGYDKHAYDWEIFQEGVRDIATAALNAILPGLTDREHAMRRVRGDW